MWYILYDEMLSERRRSERNVGRAFFTHRALSTDLRRDGRTWWWNLMVFCSQEFVVALCKYFFVRFFVSTHFMRTQHTYTLVYTVARHGDAHRWFLTSLCSAILRRSRTQNHIPAGCLSIVEFSWTIEPELFWRAHKYTVIYYRL